MLLGGFDGRAQGVRGEFLHFRQFGCGFVISRGHSQRLLILLAFKRMPPGRDL